MTESFYQLIIKRRTIRRFKPEKVPLELLKKSVNAGRLAPSAANLQPLEYILSLIHISEPTRLGMISYAVFCLKKKKK